ncbi:MAG: TIM barrel protein [Hungatella sp.]
MELSFSTTWNAHRVINGKEMIQELMAMGFSTLELNYKVTNEMLQEILPQIECGDLMISSIHNVFPKCFDPTYDTDSLLLGYPDQERRKKSIELTKTSIDYAQFLHAKALVIHPGGIPDSSLWAYNYSLKALYLTGKRQSKEYATLFQQMLEYRQSHQAYYLDLITDSLVELGEYIEKKHYSVKLGLENRANLLDIPDFHEISSLCESLSDYPIYAWYDIGHGIILKELGYHQDKDQVNKLKGKILGVHIHDALGIQDHWAPYTVGNQLDKYLDLIRDIPIRVLELNGRNSMRQVLDGTAILLSKLKENIDESV